MVLTAVLAITASYRRPADSSTAVTQLLPSEGVRRRLRSVLF